MDSHPNYKGYDAIKGKLRSLAEQSRRHRAKLNKKANAILNTSEKPKKPKTELLPHIGELTEKDMKRGIPKSWLPVLNQIRAWSDQAGLSYCPSPFDFQIAKIMGEGVCIVLWRSSRKGRVFIKASFEGGQGVGSDDAMEEIQRMIDRSAAA